MIPKLRQIRVRGAVATRTPKVHYAEKLEWPDCPVTGNDSLIRSIIVSNDITQVTCLSCLRRLKGGG